MELARSVQAVGIVWGGVHQPHAAAEADLVREVFRAVGLEAEEVDGDLLFPLERVRTQTGGPFRVFTPFWRACLALPDPAPPGGPAPSAIPGPDAWPAVADAGALAAGRAETEPGDRMAAYWEPGEAGAHARLAAFLDEGLGGYSVERDRPDHDGTSRLSPHLSFGEISVHRVWHEIVVRMRAMPAVGEYSRSASSPVASAKVASARESARVFLTELGWREFARHLLVHFPHTVTHPLRPEFAAFPWDDDPEALDAWRRGLTGYPIVDAGMRQLRATGWMHNRVRMVVASFLVKDLLLPWQVGSRVFWEELVDADLASNTLGWQWAAGCGADAAPYFRVFNPVLQGRKFDPDAAYVRVWVPELAGLSDRFIHEPWRAPSDELQRTGVILRETYPPPLVDHAVARDRALAAFRGLRAQAAIEVMESASPRTKRRFT
jgi:deoxyribodipyrimidine photo-lyase